MKRIPVTQARKDLAIVPIEDRELLEALENEEDIREAKKALDEVKEKGSISFSDMKKRLGL